jgi:putative redox protein
MGLTGFNLFAVIFQYRHCAICSCRSLIALINHLPLQKIHRAMKHRVESTWKGDMKFDTEVNGHHFMIDAEEHVGGENAGPRPKPLMLASLAGCTGMDVISLLLKMRQDVEYFNVIVEGDTEDEFPKPFYKMHIIYELRGKDLEMDKIEKAISLSMERYCGVSAVYRKAQVNLTHEVRIL